MSRVDDVRSFYEILTALTEALGGPRTLRDCHGRLGWPHRGVYFFFEHDEHRSSSGDGLRVVRVGTHALAAKSRATLWNRLAQHRGLASGAGGNHRGSIFRLLVGEALARRDRLDVATWGSGSSASAAAGLHRRDPGELRSLERPLESTVSEIIGAMPFVWIDAVDDPGPNSLRGLIERNSIALLSNAGREAIDPPSAGWLGRHSSRERVRESGLWNNNHIDEPYDPAFLSSFNALIRAKRR